MKTDICAVRNLWIVHTPLFSFFCMYRIEYCIEGLYKWNEMMDEIALNGQVMQPARKKQKKMVSVLVVEF